MPKISIACYTAKEWQWSVFLSTGRKPLTSPPFSPSTLPVQRLAGHQVIYIKLHGLPHEPRWYNARWADALDLSTVHRFPHLEGAVIFAQSCYGKESPLTKAFLDQGAAAVIGTPIQLKAGRWFPAESDWIGHYFLKYLTHGHSVQDAIDMATFKALNRNRVNEIISLSVTGDPERRFT